MHSAPGPSPRPGSGGRRHRPLGLGNPACGARWLPAGPARVTHRVRRGQAGVEVDDVRFFGFLAILVFNLHLDLIFLLTLCCKAGRRKGGRAWRCPRPRGLSPTPGSPRHVHGPRARRAALASAPLTRSTEDSEELQAQDGASLGPTWHGTCARPRLPAGHPTPRFIWICPFHAPASHPGHRVTPS